MNSYKKFFLLSLFVFQQIVHANAWIPLNGEDDVPAAMVRCARTLLMQQLQSKGTEVGKFAVPNKWNLSDRKRLVLFAHQRSETSNRTQISPSGVPIQTSPVTSYWQDYYTKSMSDVEFNELLTGTYDVPGKLGTKVILPKHKNAQGEQVSHHYVLRDWLKFEAIFPTPYGESDQIWLQAGMLVRFEMVQLSFGFEKSKSGVYCEFEHRPNYLRSYTYPYADSEDWEPYAYVKSILDNPATLESDRNFLVRWLNLDTVKLDGEAVANAMDSFTNALGSKSRRFFENNFYLTNKTLESIDFDPSELNAETLKQAITVNVKSFGRPVEYKVGNAAEVTPEKSDNGDLSNKEEQPLRRRIYSLALGQYGARSRMKVSDLSLSGYMLPNQVSVFDVNSASIPLQVKD